MTVPTTPFRITGLDHVVVRAKDIDKMIGFYRDLLGLPVAKHNEALGLWHLTAGSSMIDLVDINGTLGRTGGAPPGGANNVDHIAIAIEPFDAEALSAYFAQHGIATDPVKTRFGAQGDGPSIYVRDPEGNAIELKGRR